MATKTVEAKTGAAGSISYEEFEPYCKWQREDARDILIITLPDFKKEELKVNINNRGSLKVSGERTLDETKKSKFYKEVVVPRNCNTNGIQAKFLNNNLYIIFPKNIDAAVPEPIMSQQVDGSQISTVDQNVRPEAGKDQAPPPDELRNQEHTSVPFPTANGNYSRGKQVAKIGMPLAVLAALVAFVVYLYKSTIPED